MSQRISVAGGFDVRQQGRPDKPTLADRLYTYAPGKDLQS
jgi:hypothetical protein